jgi:hypothetical protein
MGVALVVNTGPSFEITEVTTLLCGPVQLRMTRASGSSL